MNYITEMVLLENTQPSFAFFHVLWRVNPQNSKQKHTAKNFAKFPNIYPQ